jgi:spermidine synthase
VLDSLEFYRDCRHVLDDGGVMAVNLFGRRASFPQSFARVVEAFGEDQVHALKPTPEGNTIVLAMKHVTVPGRSVLARRAENIETRWQLPARKWLRMLNSLPADPPDQGFPIPPA